MEINQTKPNQTNKLKECKKFCGFLFVFSPFILPCLLASFYIVAGEVLYVLAIESYIATSTYNLHNADFPSWRMEWKRYSYCCLLVFFRCSSNEIEVERLKIHRKVRVCNRCYDKIAAERTKNIFKAQFDIN